MSPHLGDSWIVSSAVVFEQPSDSRATTNVIEALPLGGRIKIDPWNDQLTMLKVKPVGAMTEDEKKPFQITPFAFYLTRQEQKSSTEVPGATAAKLDINTKP